MGPLAAPVLRRNPSGFRISVTGIRKFLSGLSSEDAVLAVHLMPLNRPLALARILGLADAGAELMSIKAALAWLLSVIGKLRFGPANLLVGILERADLVSFICAPACSKDPHPEP